MNINEINAGVLAYLGDSVYELEIRNYLLNKKLTSNGTPCDVPLSNVYYFQILYLFD